jgi:hypothetical protein
MHVTLQICSVSGHLAGANCDPATVTEQTLVLIRPDSQFYLLSDAVLEKIFGNSYRKTEKTIAVFRSEYPVCTLCLPPEEPSDDDE